MVKIKATRAYSYGGIQRQPGDVFEALARDARTLIAIKKAEAYVEPALQPTKPRTYLRRDLKAEE